MSLFTLATVAPNLPSNDNDDDSVSIAVISGALVGILLLIIIIIVMIVMLMIVLYRRKKSRRIHNTFNKVELSEHVPNPLYAVGPNSSETGKECEYQYDYVQTDDGSVQHDKVVGATTSGGEYDKVIDLADNVNIDPNPSYALPQDVKLENNPSYVLPQDVKLEDNPSYVATASRC